jgi:hypothetical protein
MIPWIQVSRFNHSMCNIQPWSIRLGIFRKGDYEERYIYISCVLVCSFFSFYLVVVWCLFSSHWCYIHIAFGLARIPHTSSSLPTYPSPTPHYPFTTHSITLIIFSYDPYTLHGFLLASSSWHFSCSCSCCSHYCSYSPSMFVLLLV